MTTPKEITITVTRSQAMDLLQGDLHVVEHPGIALRIKRALLGPLPAWVVDVQHAAQVSVKAFCACGAHTSWTVGGPNGLPQRCPTCKARDVHEAKNPTWPKWAFDLQDARNAAHGSRLTTWFPYDRTEARFEFWFATYRSDLQGMRLQHYLNGYDEHGAPSGPPGWYMAGYERARHHFIHLIDLHNDRSNEPDGPTHASHLDIVAGAMLERIFREEEAKGVLR
jgi:hypothetical protein